MIGLTSKQSDALRNLCQGSRFCKLRHNRQPSNFAVKVDDRAQNASLVKISRDFVRVQILHAISHDKASEELLQFMRGLLGTRSGQISVVRGESTRQKIMWVQGMSPQDIFERLEASL